jgi:mRNA interferase RelE/StbE
VTEFLIVFMPRAITDLTRLDKPIAQRILYKLKWLSQHLDDLTPDGLTGELKGFYKLRVGHYRVMYTTNEQDHLLLVHLIGHRRDIYRR